MEIYSEQQNFMNNDKSDLGDSFFSYSADIQRVIFSFLPSTEALELRRVCKRWAEVISKEFLWNMHIASSVIGYWVFKKEYFQKDKFIDLSPHRAHPAQHVSEPSFSEFGLEMKSRKGLIITDSKFFASSREMTVEAWVKLKSQIEPVWMNSIVSNHGPATGWELRANHRRQEFVVTVAGVPHVEVGIARELKLNKYYHLAGIIRNNTVGISVNGMNNFISLPLGTFSDWIGNVVIGQNPAWKERVWHGTIAKVRICRSIQPNCFFLPLKTDTPFVNMETGENKEVNIGKKDEEEEIDRKKKMMVFPKLSGN